jgi:hypothetical protein
MLLAARKHFRCPTSEPKKRQLEQRLRSEPRGTLPLAYARGSVESLLYRAATVKGAVTNVNCSALHLSGDNCFPYNHLKSGELANSRRFNYRF